MRTLLFYLLFIAMLSGCTQTSIPFPEIIVGKWEMENPELKSYEVWEKVNDTSYIGKRYTVEILNNVIQLIKINNQWNYIVVEEANNASKITYYLVNDSTSTLIFKNKTNEYPEQIEYHFRSDNKLLVHIYHNGKGYELYYNKKSN